MASCATQPPAQAPASPSRVAPSPSQVTPSPGPSVSTSGSASTTASTAPSSQTPSATGTKPPKDDRTGKELAEPYRVNGIIVVSKKHRIKASYGPLDPSGPYGLERAAAKALTRMTAAAAKDGVRVRVHSGYRNWTTQNASYQRAKRTQPQNISFYAPAGASEHQTGLAVDLWDGTTWYLPMANTATGKWLFKHAHEYGFVLRYPEGKTKITGYHYEPWHYRYIGKKDAMQFPNNRLTLEEYLGLA